MNGWTNYHCHTRFVDPDVDREMTPAFYAGQLGERMRRAVLLNHGYSYYYGEHPIVDVSYPAAAAY